jgi:hypothetical protein
VICACAVVCVCFSATVLGAYAQPWFGVVVCCVAITRQSSCRDSHRFGWLAHRILLNALSAASSGYKDVIATVCQCLVNDVTRFRVGHHGWMSSLLWSCGLASCALLWYAA